MHSPVHPFKHLFMNIPFFMLLYLHLLPVNLMFLSGLSGLWVTDRMKLPANGTVEVWDAGKAFVISQGIAFTKKGVYRRKGLGIISLAHRYNVKA